MVRLKKTKSQGRHEQATKKRLHVWLFRCLLIALPPAAGVVVYLFLTKFPVFTTQLLHAANSTGTNTTLHTALTTLSLVVAIVFCLAVLLFLYINFSMHARPLRIEDPSVPYTLRHHTKLVILPLVRYKKKKISFVILYPVFVLLFLTTSISMSFSHVLAALPTITTVSATNVTSGSATLSGNLTDTGGVDISSRGFEYGLDTNYGQTLSETLSTNNTYETWGEIQDGNSYGKLSVVYHDNHVYVGSIGKVQKFNTSGVLVDTIGSFGQADGSLLAAGGVAVDSSGDIYVLDSGDPSDPGWRAVNKFDSNGNFIERWGDIGGTDEGQIRKGGGGIVIDSSDNLYVLDSGNNRIQKFDTDGNFISMWGWGVDDGSSALQVCTSGCQAGLSGVGDGQLGSGARKFYLDGSSIYVADSSNNRIQKFGTDGSFITKWGSAGTGNGQFSFPSGVTIAGSTVYVTDGMNNRIQAFDTDGNFQNVWGTAGTGNGQLSLPLALTADQSNNIYTIEFSVARVQKFTTSGTYVASWGEPGTGELAMPSAVAIAPDGSVYSTSQVTYSMHKFDSNGDPLTSWGDGLGTGDGQFGGAMYGVAVDSSGNVYVTDKNERVQKFDSSGNFLDKWGTLGSSEEQFNTPIGITIDSGNNVYVADKSNNRVQKFDTDGNFISMWGWGVDDGSAALQVCTSGCQAGSSGAGDGQFSFMGGITVDNDGSILITDSSRVQKFDTNGVYLSQWALSGQSDGGYIAVDANDNVFVSGTEVVNKYDSNGTFLAQVGAEGYGPEEYDDPKGIVIDSSGSVLVADENKSLLHRYPQPFDSTYSLTTTKLLCETTYHYRAFATNEDGTGYGADDTFTTDSCANATAPSAPEDFSTILITYNSIVLGWNEPDSYGGSAITGYTLDYKKSSDVSWTAGGTYSENGLTDIIGNLDDETSYDFRVAAINDVGTGPYATLTASTFVGGASHTISSCADLYTINYDLIGTYTLTQDIDCAGYNQTIVTPEQTIQFNGFLPIGLWGEYGFQGTLNGNGHTISNLEINAGQHELAPGFIHITTGLFTVTMGATIENIHLEDITYTGEWGGLIGGFAGLAVRTEFTDVSVTGSMTSLINQENANVPYAIGGIAGMTQFNSTLNKVLSNVAITVNNTADESDETNVAVGGIVGSVIPYGGKDISPYYANRPEEWDTEFPVPGEELGGTLENTYSMGSITVNGNGGSTSVAGIGGLVGSVVQGVIRNSYAAGVLTSNNNSLGIIGGLVATITSGPATVLEPKIENSFVAATMINDTPVENLPTGVTVASLPFGLVVSAQAPYNAVNMSNNYFDQTITNQSICFIEGIVSGPPPEPNTDDSKCLAVNVGNTQPSYFKNNITNAPFDTWDFDNVWYAWTTEYPKFLAESIVGPPVDPPVDPPVEPPTPTAPTTPTTPTTPKKPRTPTTTPSGGTPTAEAPFPVNAQELLEPAAAPQIIKVKGKKIRQPKAAALLPFVFISLLLLLALIYALKSWKEYRRVQAVKALLVRYRITNDNVRAFVRIIAHYLNTPVAIMQSSLELIVSKKAVPPTLTTAVYNKLRGLGGYVASVQNTAQTTLAPPTDDASATVGDMPNARQAQLLKSKQVWVPLLGVAVAIAVTDLLLLWLGGYKLASLRILNHVILFGFGAVLLIAMAYLRKRQLALHQEHQQLIATEQALHQQQSGMLGDTASALDEYSAALTKTSNVLNDLPEAKTYFNGLTMLNKLIASLNFARTTTTIQDRLPTQSLGAAISNATTELQEQIAQKGLTITNSVPASATIAAESQHADFIVRTLLENAVQFSAEKGTIEMSGSSSGGKTNFAVIDHGSGIPKEKLDDMFTPFSRGTSVETYNQQGIGLGLYNLKLLVDQLGGKLSVANNRSGGVTASVSLPKPKTK